MTTEELLKDALNKLDLINRPNIIFVNPKDKEMKKYFDIIKGIIQSYR